MIITLCTWTTKSDLSSIISYLLICENNSKFTHYKWSKSSTSRILAAHVKIIVFFSVFVNRFSFGTHSNAVSLSADKFTKCGIVRREVNTKNGRLILFSCKYTLRWIGIKRLRMRRRKTWCFRRLCWHEGLPRAG